MLLYPNELITKRTKQKSILLLLIIIQNIFYIAILILSIINVKALSKGLFVTSLSIITILDFLSSLFIIDTVQRIKRTNRLFLKLNTHYNKQKVFIKEISPFFTTINKNLYYDCTVLVDSEIYHYYLYTTFKGALEVNQTYTLLVNDYYIVGVDYD